MVINPYGAVRWMVDYGHINYYNVTWRSRFAFGFSIVFRKEKRFLLATAAADKRKFRNTWTTITRCVVVEVVREVSRRRRTHRHSLRITTIIIALKRDARPSRTIKAR